jgi:hypothetical protein
MDALKENDHCSLYILCSYHSNANSCIITTHRTYCFNLLFVGSKMALLAELLYCNSALYVQITQMPRFIYHNHSHNVSIYHLLGSKMAL